MGHNPEHEGHALAQGALALELELEISFPDVIDGRNRQSGYAASHRMHELEIR